MAERLVIEEHHTPEHSAAHKSLELLAFQLNQASVSLILISAQRDEEQRKAQYRVVSSHLLSALSTLSSILRLTDSLSLNVKEAVALARIYYETCLVAAFTSLDNGERARRAELHSIYKTFRTQTEVQKAGIHLLKVERAQRLSRHDAHVKEATTLFGNSKATSPCFAETREEMIIEVTKDDTQAGLFFGGVEGMVFDVSSEIIHGSYHGFQLFNYLHNAQSDNVKNLMGHYETVFFSVCLCTAGLTRLVRKRLAPTPEMGRIVDSSISALLPFIPKEMAEEMGSVISGDNN